MLNNRITDDEIVYRDQKSDLAKILITESAPLLRKNGHDLVKRQIFYNGSPGQIVSMITSFIEYYCKLHNRNAKDFIVFVNAMLESCDGSTNLL